MVSQLAWPTLNFIPSVGQSDSVRKKYKIESNLTDRHSVAKYIRSNHNHSEIMVFLCFDCCLCRLFQYAVATFGNICLSKYSKICWNKLYTLWHGTFVMLWVMKAKQVLNLSIHQTKKMKSIDKCHNCFLDNHFSSRFQAYNSKK